MKVPFALIATGASVLAGGALAQTPAPPAKAPLAVLALEAAQTAVATCTANGYAVGATVVDAAGFSHVVFSADGARGQAVDSSFRKAYTAAAFKTASASIEASVKTDTALAAKVAADPKMFARAGAVPIMAAGELIGAIGVGGAPGGDKDEVCAKAGLAKIAGRLK